MSLRGTLETLALPDLLTVLAATRRSGQLVVRAGRFEGRLWLAQGELVKADVPNSTDLEDALFTLLRLGTGEFSFEADANPLPSEDAVPVQEVLLRAQGRRSEWLALEAAVPSLAARFQLAADPAGETVAVAAGHWRVLVGLAAGADVKGVIENLGLPELEARRAVRALLDAGVILPAAVRASGPAPAPERLLPTPPLTSEASPPEAEAPAGEVDQADDGAFDEVEPEPPTVPRGEDEPVDRGLLFRYLSGESF